MTNERLSSIPKSVIDRLPESVARENSVIPIGATDDEIIIAASINVAADDIDTLSKIALLHDKLEFILQCRVQLEEHPLSDINAALDRHYTYIAKIDNCTWSFKTQCPQLWFNLDPTDDAEIRYCSICSKNVYYCQTPEMVTQHSLLGRCVAVYNGPSRFETIGDVELRTEQDA